jgi:hypothetical protein
MDVREIHSHKNDVCGVTNVIPGKCENQLEILLTLVAEQSFSKSYLWASFPSLLDCLCHKPVESSSSSLYHRLATPFGQD